MKRRNAAARKGGPLDSSAGRAYTCGQLPPQVRNCWRNSASTSSRRVCRSSSRKPANNSSPRRSASAAAAVAEGCGGGGVCAAPRQRPRPIFAIIAIQSALVAASTTPDDASPCWKLQLRTSDSLSERCAVRARVALPQVRPLLDALRARRPTRRAVAPDQIIEAPARGTASDQSRTGAAADPGAASSNRGALEASATSRKSDNHRTGDARDPRWCRLVFLFGPANGVTLPRSSLRY